MDRGIFISGAGSWSIDQQRDNFQFGGQIFWEIRNGKLGPMLRDVAYQARTVPFWNSLDGIGGKSTYQLHGAFHLRQGAAHTNRTCRAWRRACALQGRDHPQHGAERYLTMMLSPDEVKAIASSIIGRSGAEACTVSISGGDSRNFRFARNEATTNGAASSVSVSIELSFGKRAGSASVNSLDEGDLDEARLRSEEIARLSPENSEYMPPLGPQTYEPGGARYDSGTARTQAVGLAHAAASAIAAGRNHEVGIAGFIEAGCGFRALSNSAGLFAYDRGSSAKLTVTARHTRRAWSGWAGASQNRFLAIDPVGLGERAVGKALFPGEAADLDPGAYTVILEPAATADLVQRLVYSMAARSADEGRSFLSQPGGGTKLGERLLDEAVTITSDPANADAPDTLFGPDGVPKRRTVWFERGVAKTMSIRASGRKKWAASRSPLRSTYPWRAARSPSRT